MHGWIYIGNMEQTIGSRIRTARKFAGLAQDDLAIPCGVRRLTIASWESGETVPRADQVIAIASSTGVAASWILTGEGRGPDSATSAPSAA